MKEQGETKKRCLFSTSNFTDDDRECVCPKCEDTDCEFSKNKK